MVYNPRMESCEKTLRKQESCDLSFFKNQELFLDYAFMPVLGVADRSEFTSDCSLHLVMCLCASMGKHVFAKCSLSLSTLLRRLFYPGV